ncbi:MAG: alpha-L-arabinofuranosidase C-terminal domain-containing protein [Kiritimatiellia bacterium]
MHLDLTRFVKERGHQILWDVHVFNKQDNPAESYGGHLPGGVEFSRWLTRLEPSLGTVPVLIGEFNAGRYNYCRGLGHAVELAQAHRAGDVVRGAAIPNVSQPAGVFQSDWKAVLWTQGNFDYTPDRVWFQSSYHVQKMVADAWAPDVLEVAADAPRGTLDVFAAKSEDGRRLVLRVVNMTRAPRRVKLEVAGFTPARPVARTTTLAHGDLLDANTAAIPDLIRPVAGEWRHGGLAAPCEFPPLSFTVLELE